MANNLIIKYLNNSSLEKSITASNYVGNIQCRCFSTIAVYNNGSIYYLPTIARPVSEYNVTRGTLVLSYRVYSNKRHYFLSVENSTTTPPAKKQLLQFNDYNNNTNIPIVDTWIDGSNDDGLNVLIGSDILTNLNITHKDLSYSGSFDLYGWNDTIVFSAYYTIGFLPAYVIKNVLGINNARKKLSCTINASGETRLTATVTVNGYAGSFVCSKPLTNGNRSGFKYINGGSEIDLSEYWNRFGNWSGTPLTLTSSNFIVAIDRADIN